MSMSARDVVLVWFERGCVIGLLDSLYVWRAATLPALVSVPKNKTGSDEVDCGHVAAQQLSRVEDIGVLLLQLSALESLRRSFKGLAHLVGAHCKSVPVHYPALLKEST